MEPDNPQFLGLLKIDIEAEITNLCVALANTEHDLKIVTAELEKAMPNKNPHAVALGKKGGKKTGRKGFAAMPKAKVKAIRALALAARRLDNDLFNKG